ncbi:RNA polymerase sigma factor [Persicirhabdus sediminis]|uniref:RNA polymerase sigma factor n=1 Tax=Persicirhabdus sediminis TaxID=454144 RepID=A0A8J7MAF1_9BACT|nr:RNA polymerase sigma factor [Persicirhabdus sediminis]MBK1789894.1 RNA polymerase sigma factor [Persicirhabdus sediminis]
MIEEETDSANNANNASVTTKWRPWLSEHGSKLLLFARQQTRSTQDAEDILQDALVKLARKVDEGTFEGGQEAWLPYVYTAIRRLAIDYGRKNDRRRLREEKVEADRQVMTGGAEQPWFNSDEVNEETSAILQDGLKNLPEKFAEVLTMKIWGEQTFAEIGQSLGITLNTAASRYRYGLEHLKKHLDAARKRGDL